MTLTAPQKELVEILTTIFVSESRASLGPHPAEEAVARRQAHRAALIIGGHAGAVIASHYDPEPEQLAGRPVAEIPEALGDEDGERWLVQGHVDAPLIVLAAVVEQMVNVGAAEAAELLVGVPARMCSRPSPCYRDQRKHADRLMIAVDHVWLRWDPDDEENMLAAEPGEPGAMPFTVFAP